jgi:hypothetical protein
MIYPYKICGKNTGVVTLKKNKWASMAIARTFIVARHITIIIIIAKNISSLILYKNVNANNTESFLCLNLTGPVTANPNLAFLPVLAIIAMIVIY